MMIRIRPPLPAIGEKAMSTALTVEPRAGRKGGIVSVTKGQAVVRGEFDGVLPPEASQQEVYEQVQCMYVCILTQIATCRLKRDCSRHMSTRGVR